MIGRFAGFAVAVALLFSAAQAAEPADAEVRASVQQFYAPFASDTVAMPDWELPIFTAETAVMIRDWREALGDEPIDDLSSFGWLCECQDWDAAAFRVTVTSVELAGKDHAIVAVTVEQGWGSKVEQKLELLREDGDWRLDDMLSDSFPNGLKAELAYAAGY